MAGQKHAANDARDGRATVLFEPATAGLLIEVGSEWFHGVKATPLPRGPKFMENLHVGYPW